MCSQGTFIHHPLFIQFKTFRRKQLRESDRHDVQTLRICAFNIHNLRPIHPYASLGLPVPERVRCRGEGARQPGHSQGAQPSGGSDQLAKSQRQGAQWCGAPWPESPSSPRETTSALVRFPNAPRRKQIPRRHLASRAPCGSPSSEKGRRPYPRQ